MLNLGLYALTRAAAVCARAWFLREIGLYEKAFRKKGYPWSYAFVLGVSISCSVFQASSAHFTRAGM